MGLGLIRLLDSFLAFDYLQLLNIVNVSSLLNLCNFISV